MFTACGQTKNKRTVQKKSIAMEIQSTNTRNPYYSNTDTKKIKVSDAE
jgi:hypothetical protein